VSDGIYAYVQPDGHVVDQQHRLPDRTAAREQRRLLLDGAAHPRPASRSRAYATPPRTSPGPRTGATATCDSTSTTCSHHRAEPMTCSARSTATLPASAGLTQTAASRRLATAQAGPSVAVTVGPVQGSCHISWWQLAAPAADDGRDRARLV